MATLVDYLKNNKTYVITFFVILVIGIASIIFTYNDYFLYEKTIAKVTETKEEFVETEKAK